MVESIATLLNTLIQRVLFNHMTIFLTFLFVSFVFTPPEWEAFLLSKQTENVPDWLSLLTFGRVIFTCLATMAWILFERCLKWLWKQVDGYCYPRIRRYFSFRAWGKITKTLTQDEWDIVERFMHSGGILEKFSPSDAFVLLEAKGIIRLTHASTAGYQRYLLNPKFKAFMQSEIQKEQGV